MNNKKINNLPMVAIFGRTNVGKSTLFNRLTESKQALVADIPGTTRDSNIKTVEWEKRSFRLVDTGGIMDLKYLLGKKSATDDIEAKVQTRAREYLRAADLILFVVDCKDGPLPTDKEMSLLAKKIRADGRDLLLVVNKADTPSARRSLAEYYRLGLGDPMPVSAANGSGTGDLLDEIVKRLNRSKTTKKTEAPIEQETINVAIIGQPNVGKSSLINSILGEERMIVSPIAHTTREPQDMEINYEEKNICFVDTAGLSRRGQQPILGKQEQRKALEKKSIAKALAALSKADIALFMLDVTQPITHQDTKIIEEITSRGKSLIIIANKWDLIKDKDTEKFSHYIYSRLPFAQWAPLQFVSAKTGAKVKNILSLVVKVDAARKKELSDSQLSHFLSRIVKLHRPTKGKGVKHPHIFEIKQTFRNPPEFSIRIGAKEDLHFSYLRFVENRLRENYDFLATPLRIKIIKNPLIHGKHER